MPLESGYAPKKVISNYDCSIFQGTKAEKRIEISVRFFSVTALE